MKTGNRARATRNFELALQAKEEQVDAAVVSRRLEYLAALDEPVRADLSGKWSGTMWTSDGQTDEIPLEGGMVIGVSLSMQGGTMKGRWVDVKGGNSGPVELARSIR